jgi:hypothetical protein
MKTFLEYTLLCCVLLGPLFWVISWNLIKRWDVYYKNRRRNNPDKKSMTPLGQGFLVIILVTVSMIISGPLAWFWLWKKLKQGKA